MQCALSVIADHLRNFRLRRGVSIDAFAKQIGWSVERVAEIEQAKRAISLAELVVLCEGLNQCPETVLMQLAIWFDANELPVGRPQSPSDLFVRGIVRQFECMGRLLIHKLVAGSLEFAERSQ